MEVNKLSALGDQNTKLDLNIANTARVFTGGLERMRIDSSGRIGIGTSSPANQLDVVSSTNATARIEGGANGDASLKLTESGISGFQLKYDGGDNNLYVGGGTSGSFTTHMAVNRDSGNVGIGTSSPASLLHVQRNGTAVSSGLDSQTAATFQSTGASGSSTHVNILAGSTGSSGQAVLTFGDADDSDIGRITYRNGDNSMAFMTNASEAMRITSGGHLLVGKTATAFGTDGTEVQADGLVRITRDGASALQINRKNSDGSIVTFNKDSANVGSIGVGSGDLHIYSSASGHKGLRFGLGYIAPANNSGTIDDNNVDLGYGGGSPARFKDLYLSGGAYLGGTAAANKLDDYEEGTFTPL